MAKPEYVSLGDVYDVGAGGISGISIEDAYTGFSPWKQRMGDVVAEAQQLTEDPKARKEYTSERWREYARLWATSAFAKSQMVENLNAPEAVVRESAENNAQIALLDFLSSDDISSTDRQFQEEFYEEGAWHQTLKKFLVKRQRIGQAFSKQYRQRNPKAPDVEVEKAAMDELRKFGYHDDAQNLPPLQFAPDEKDSIWWQATKEVVTGLPRGAYRGTLDLISSGWELGLAAGEAFTDREREPHGEELIPEPEDPYIGARRGIAVPIRRPDPNVYRMLRLTHAKTMEEIAPVPQPETFVGKLAAGIGQALPQLAVMAQGAAAARGLVVAGKTTQAMAIRGATMGTMFSLEGAGAFKQYMQYAKEKGLSPEQTSMTALLGALVYASASTALEYAGPFNALEKRIPGMKRRLAAMALMGATEGGTEFLQSITQEALAYGLDLRDLTWENIQNTIQQAAMEGSVGVLAGGLIGGVTFRSQTTGDVDTDIDVDDPEGTFTTANEMVTETDRQEHGVDRVEEAGPPPAEVVPPPPRTREQVIEHMIEATPEVERSEVTEPAFTALLDTLRYGKENFVEVDVPIGELNLNLLEQEETPERQQDIAAYAQQPRETVPAVVAGSVDEDSGLMVVDGVRRIQAAQLRGDTTVRALIPTSDLEVPTEAIPEAPVAPEPTEIEQVGIIPGETSEETETRVRRELPSQQIEKDAILGETDETLRTVQASAPINVTEQDPEHPIRRLLSDETGAVGADAFTEVLARPLKAAGEMVGEGVDVVAAVSHFGFQTARTLQSTPQGRDAVLFMNQVYHQGRFDTAQALKPWYDAWRGLSLIQRQAAISWMRQYREDGQTNWATLIEHPERMEGVTVPTGIQNLRDAYEFGFRYSGRNASKARVPQRIFVRDEKGEVTVQTRIFEPSADLKYQRRLTPEGRAIIRLRTGPGWDALLAWLETHPDRNPGLPTDSTALKETLRRITESAQTKKIGALEFVRVFEELPIALKINGKWEDIQVRDPMSHHETNMFRESQRAAMWRVANELLWHYGDKYRIENLNTVNLDTAIDRMRMEVSQGAGKKASRHAAVFDASLYALEHSEQGSMTKELFGEFSKSSVVKLATLPVKVAWTNAIQLSSIWDIGNAAKTTGIVNWGGWLKGEASAWQDMLKHPLKYGAEYEALGAFSDAYHDWTYHRDNIVDLLHKGVTDIGGVLLRASERVSQFRVARMADLWIQGMNRQAELSSMDADMLRRYARLTEAQIGEIARGKMSERTQAIAVQAMVAQIAAFSEAPHMKGAIQRHPTLRWFIRGTQVPAATLRQGLNLADEIRDGWRSYRAAETPADREVSIKKLGSALLRMGSLAVVVGGTLGAGGMILRRLIKRQPVFQPDDPDSWYGWSLLMLAEGGMFGPLGQLLDAAKYSEPDLRTYGYHALFPAAVGIDMVAFVGGVVFPEKFGWLRDHPTTPFWERARRDFLRYFPAIKAIDRWMTAMHAPSRDKFYQVRRWSQEWQKAQDIPYTGLARAEARRKRIYPYQMVWEAIRDGNPIALDEALNEYVEYARQQGWDLKDTKGRIDSSLAAKQPIPLKKAHKKQFIESLPAERRAIVEAEMARYKQTRQEIKRRLGVLHGTE